MGYPIENLFRPAVEYTPAFVSLSGAILLVSAHEWFFLPKEVVGISALSGTPHGVPDKVSGFPDFSGT